jgi:hypothetical protein
MFFDTWEGRERIFVDMMRDFLTLDIRWGDWAAGINDGCETILQQQQRTALRMGRRFVCGHVCVHHECWVYE